MIEGDVFITPHAVRQYQTRTRAGRGMQFEAARAHLVEQVAKARAIKPTGRGGAVLFRGPKPERLRLVIGPGEGDKPALVTVLTRSDHDLFLRASDKRSTIKSCH
jgi:hypothetical protein